MRTGVYYKATGGCTGLIQNFSVIPDPPAHATMGVAARDEFMPPLVVLSVRHVGFRSFRNRRHIAIAEFDGAG